jgi:hypothetical protein
MYEDKTIAEEFAGCFQESYNGAQEDRIGREDFMRVTDSRISWSQVHGDFKDLAKRGLFAPYEHWRELHECCGIAVRVAISLDKLQIYSGLECARIMGAAMKILKGKYGHNAPRWWLPLLKKVRGA